MGIRDRLVGWLWNEKAESWRKPEFGAEIWIDAAGNKRTAVMTRSYGLDGPNWSMCGLPDPDVRYPEERADPFEAMAEEGPNSAAWYRGLYQSEFFD